MNWISVKDRLPEDGEEVIAFSEQNVTAAIYDGPESYGGECWTESKLFYCDVTFDHLEHVTHWMPLPDPPRMPAVTVCQEDHNHDVFICKPRTTY